MQLKQFYNIATKVSSRKNATTFGDLPDCSVPSLSEHFLYNSTSQELYTPSSLLVVDFINNRGSYSTDTGEIISRSGWIQTEGY